MDARQSRRGKRISLQQEKRAASDLGGRTMAASGALPMGGGADVRLMGKIRLECKFTEKNFYSLKVIELRKLRKQAEKVLEMPVLQFAFRYPTGQLEQYAVIQWDSGADHVDDTIETEWTTNKKSFSMTPAMLQKAVSKGRVRLTFSCIEQGVLRIRYFQILKWSEFVERQNTNA